MEKMENRLDKQFAEKCSPPKILKEVLPCGVAAGETEGAKIADLVKDKRHSGNRAKDEITQKRETSEDCVICG